MWTWWVVGEVKRVQEECRARAIYNNIVRGFNCKPAGGAQHADQEGNMRGWGLNHVRYQIIYVRYTVFE